MESGGVRASAPEGGEVMEQFPQVWWCEELCVSRPEGWSVHGSVAGQ